MLLYLKDPSFTTIYEKWAQLLSPAYLASHKLQEIAQRVNAHQFPKQQPNPSTCESFQEETQDLMFGEKAEALSSHTSLYVWPRLAPKGSADFEARI